MTKYSANRRIIFISIPLGLVFFALLGRLYYLQQMRHDNFLALATNQHIRKVQIEPNRGAILDRNSKALAINVKADSVFADPRKVVDPHLCARKLAEILGVNEKKTYKRLTKKKSFVWIKRKVDKDITAKIKHLKLEGIYLKEETKRIYPKENLLSHVLGFTGIDGNGLEGLERTMNDTLAGTFGWRISTKDAKRRELLHCIPIEQPVKHGNSVELTIDEIIQYIAETELSIAFRKYSPVWAGILIMRPRTGEILAMATMPTYNPNNFADYPKEFRRNRVISDIFEPGSIFKIISCVSALNEGAVKFSDVFDCENGSFRAFGHTLHDCNQYEYLTFPQIIAVSSNIGAAKIAMNLGGKKLYRYLRDFDFGVKPDIALSGEAKGLMHPYKNWSKLSILSIPMGQEISVSMLQMLKAVSAVANEGIMMKPYIIKRIISADNKTIKENSPQEIRHIVSLKTSKAMNEALKLVVARGTGINANIEEYTVAGKTGTAQKVDQGRYSDTKYVGSFVGYAPADDPEISMLVIMDEPQKQHYGGVVSAPVFREVARKVLKYLEIPPELDRLPLSQNHKEKGGSPNDSSG